MRGLARRRPTGLEWRVRGKDELACVGLKLLSRSTHANARTRSERGRVRRVERLVCARSLFGRARFVSFIPFRSKDTAGARGAGTHGTHGHTDHTGEPHNHPYPQRTSTTARRPWNARSPRRLNSRSPGSDRSPRPTQKRPLPRCKYVHRKSLIAHSMAHSRLIQGTHTKLHKTASVPSDLSARTTFGRTPPARRA